MFSVDFSLPLLVFGDDKDKELMRTLMEELNRMAGEWNCDREEREQNYPKTRARIRKFIAECPEQFRDKLTSVLLPHKVSVGLGR